MDLFDFQICYKIVEGRVPITGRDLWHKFPELGLTYTTFLKKLARLAGVKYKNRPNSFSERPFLTREKDKKGDEYKYFLTKIATHELRAVIRIFLPIVKKSFKNPAQKKFSSPSSSLQYSKDEKQSMVESAQSVINDELIDLLPHPTIKEQERFTRLAGRVVSSVVKSLGITFES